jgi:hypothetical protein
MDVGARPHMCGVFLMFVLTLADGLCLCLVCTSCLVLVLMSGDREQLYRLGPTEWVLLEEGGRIQSPKCVLNKNRAANNTQKQ